MYTRNIYHDTEVKFIDNRYNSLVAIEFRTTILDTSMNLSFNKRNIFVAVKLIDSSSTIVTKSDTVIKHPNKFLMGAYYTKSFSVIKDKTFLLPFFFVYHNIISV